MRRHIDTRCWYGRVGVWRSGGRPNISVAAPFVWRCLTGSAVALFPHHRVTGGGHPPPVPTERGMRISRTNALRKLVRPCRAFSPHARAKKLARAAECRLFLDTERGFGGKPPKKSWFRRHLAGSKMPKETFFTAISRWRVVSRRALDASGFWQA